MHVVKISAHASCPHLTSAGMQIYGVPTVRHDIKAPKKQSIANAQNYGNEPNSKHLIHPATMVERGINEQHFLQHMSKDAMRSDSCFGIAKHSCCLLLEQPVCFAKDCWGSFWSFKSCS